MIIPRRHRIHRRQLLPTYHQMIITVAAIITAIATMIMSTKVKATIHATILSSISIWDTCSSAFSNSMASTSITLNQVFAFKRRVKPTVRRVSSIKRNSFETSAAAIERPTTCASWTRSMIVRRRANEHVTVRLFLSSQRTISVKHRGRRPNSTWHFVKRSTNCCKVCRIRTPH